jgi:putative peptidoglycan binding protein/uncharacterized protein DUF1236
MRKPFLMSTVALLAGLAVASAQQMPGGDGQRSGAAQKQERGATTSAQKEQSREGEAGRSKGEAQGKQGERGQQGKSGESKSGGSKSGESKSSTTGQGGREQSKQAEPQKGKQGQQGKEAERGKAEQGKQAGETKSGTTGQGGREQNKQEEPRNSKQGQPGKAAERGKAEQGKQGNEPSTTGQSEREPGTNQRDRQGQTGQTQQGRQGDAAEQRRGGVQGSVQLTTEQRTQIREQVLTRSNAPRVDSVNFSINVGTTVPTRVRVVEVPDVLIRIHPEWRGHRYFVVRDEIVIVDNSHRIVSVVPVGSSGAQLDNRDRGSVGVRSGAAMNLSVEEIREVQLVLVREGFDVEVDGRLGRKTHDALISFQRKNGLQASGQIDTQTVTKLGVNVRSGGQSTTGQGGRQEGRDNMPSREQGRQDQQGGDRNNQRSDQDRRDGNAPSNTEGRGDQRSEQDRNANAPSTTGQGGQQGSERGSMSRDQGNMPKGQQDNSQNRTPSNRDREK